MDVTKGRRDPVDVNRMAAAAAEHVRRQIAADRPKQRTPTKGRFGQDKFGDPIHYDPKKYPPGSTIPSEMFVTDDTEHRLTEEEHLTQTLSMFCQKCGDGFTCRRDWKVHNADVHDGTAMWANTPAGKPSEVRYRAGGKRADGMIRSTRIDGLGRTIEGTRKQIDAELKRHDLEKK